MSEPELGRLLGEGTDGEVYESHRGTAIKACKRERVYWNELKAYLHLREWGIVEKLGEFYIPSLRGRDDELLVVEMDFMHTAPFVIDFGKSSLFRSPDYSEQTLDDNEANGQLLSGENWPRVRRLLADFESYQLYYHDPKPWNIVF